MMMARDNRIDSLKGLLIILVVLGHVITTLDNNNIINHAVMGVIYVFHMPLFILISGYLTKSPAQQTPREMWRGVKSIFITLVVFHLLSSILSSTASTLAWAVACTDPSTPEPTETWTSYFGAHCFKALKNFPYGILWYLMSLIYWRVMLYYTPQSLLKRPALYLVIAIVVSLLCGLTHLGKLLSLQRTLNFYLFFLLGYYYRQGALNSRWWHASILHGATAVVLLPLIFVLYPHCGNVMNGADHYDLVGLPQKALILTCSVAMSLLVFNLVRDFKWLRPVGRDSLFYYLYHFYLISIILETLVMIFHWPTTLPFILLYTAAVMGVLALMTKVPLFWWLMRPSFGSRAKDSKG